MPPEASGASLLGPLGPQRAQKSPGGLRGPLGPHGPMWGPWGPIGPFVGPYGALWARAALRECAKRNLRLSALWAGGHLQSDPYRPERSTDLG